MFTALFVTLIVGCALIAGLFVAGAVLRVLLSLIFLPFRILGWLLFLPFLLLKGLFGLVVFPVLVVTMGVLVVGLALPLLPVIAIGLFVWVLIRAACRPAAV